MGEFKEEFKEIVLSVFVGGLFNSFNWLNKKVSRREKALPLGR